MCERLEIETSSEEQTIELGAAVGKILRPGDVVLLVGDLGSGKTRLAKGIVAAATGVSPDEVVSPTFTLINCFEGDFPVHHADLYRLEPDAVGGIGRLGSWAERINTVKEYSRRQVVTPV